MVWLYWITVCTWHAHLLLFCCRRTVCLQSIRDTISQLYTLRIASFHNINIITTIIIIIIIISISTTITIIIIFIITTITIISIITITFVVVTIITTFIAIIITIIATIIISSSSSSSTTIILPGIPCREVWQRWNEVKGPCSLPWCFSLRWFRHPENTDVQRPKCPALIFCWRKIIEKLKYNHWHQKKKPTTTKTAPTTKEKGHVLYCFTTNLVHAISIWWLSFKLGSRY